MHVSGDCLSQRWGPVEISLIDIGIPQKGNAGHDGKGNSPIGPLNDVLALANRHHQAWGPQTSSCIERDYAANQAMEESHDHFTERHTSHRSPQRNQPALGQRGRWSAGLSVARVSGDLVRVAQADTGARGALHGHRTRSARLRRYREAGLWLR